jgi:hypothetical protein
MIRLIQAMSYSCWGARGKGINIYGGYKVYNA